MITRNRATLCALLAASVTFGLVAPANAQVSQWSDDPVFVPSPENFTLELRIGTFQPPISSLNTRFNGDLGPAIGLQFDWQALRIPYVGALGVGAGFTWVEWTGGRATGNDEDTVGMSLTTLRAVAVLRVDVLARELDIPLVLTGRFGVDTGYWATSTQDSDRQSADGWTAGLHWSAQAALELDFLEPRAARRLDDDWGINHTYVFGEVYGSHLGMFSDRMLPLGQISWAAGLGFTF